MTARITFSVALAALTVTVAPAAAGFGPAHQISPVRSLPPHPAVDARGDGFVAWWESPGSAPCPDPATSRVMLAQRAPGKPWHVHPVTGRGATHPDLAVSDSGRVAMAWVTGESCSQGFGAQGQLHAVTYPRGERGRPAVLSRSVLVGGPTARAVAAGRDSALVVWEDASGGGRVMAALAGASGRFGRSRALSGPGARLPRVAMNDAGVAVVSWQVGNGPTTAQYVYRRPGGWFGKPVTVASGGSYGPTTPSAAVAGRGEAAICWSQGSPATTYCTFRTVAGHSRGMRVLMPGNGGIYSAGRRSFFALAVATTNGFRHTTQMVFSPDGGASFGAPEELPGANSYGLAGAVADDAGTALAVWIDGPSVPPSLYASERSAGGAWSSPSTLVGGMVNPAFGFGRSRHVIAAWLTPGADTRVVVADGTLPG